MTYNKPLKQAIEKHDIIKARAAIITYVDNDATNEQHIGLKIADEISKLFQDKNMSFYEEDDGRLNCSLPNISTSELWNKAKAALSLNFSREKIVFATQIAHELRMRGETGFLPKKQSKPVNNQPHSSHFATKDDRDSVGAASSPQDYYRPQAPQSTRRSSSRTSQHHKPHVIGSRKSSSSQQTAMAGAIIVGVVVGGVVGAVIGATVVGAVVGGAVGGGVTYYKKK
jgi:hypothetical protein